MTNHCDNMPLSFFLTFLHCWCDLPFALSFRSMMSGGVNVKTSRGPPSSGIPLPRSLLPSSPKADPRRHASDLPRASTQTPKHTPTHTPVHSPLLFPRCSGIPGHSSRDLLRDARLKSQLFQRTGALPASQVSRSAGSSPLTQRRIPHTPPHAKDNVDPRKPALSQPQILHHSNHNRNTFNNNPAWGSSNLRPPALFRRADNCTDNTLSKTQGEVELPQNNPSQSTMLNNSNLYSSLTQTSYKQAMRAHSGSTSQSDEDMGDPEDSSPVSTPGPLPLPPIIFPMPIMSKMAVLQNQSLVKEALSTEAHTTKVNMAAVAPFSFK